MDILIVEPLEPEVMQWLGERHAVRYAPELARDPRALRQSLFNVRALIIPPSVALDSQVLNFAPVLRAVGRLSSGAENIDVTLKRSTKLHQMPASGRIGRPSYKIVAMPAISGP